jgi:hypothetical protein
VADEYFFLNRDTLTDKGVARYFTACSDFDSFLDFNKAADSRFIAYLTAIQVYHAMNFHSFTDFYVG